MKINTPKIYLETTVVSYLSARSSRDLVVVAHQEITKDWWEQQRSNYEIFVSDLVYLEAERGDSQASHQRIELIKSFKILANTAETQTLAEQYVREIPLPAKAAADAIHLAIATQYHMDYLLTWNCRHIANGVVRRRLDEINRGLGIFSPTICTPEELLYGIETME
jgi:predicted nucleic acid-binding protein